MATKTCFVVMGFGEKTDYQTQRGMNLDKTHQGIIKPAVEESRMTCIRADDIMHAGVIDKPIYEAEKNLPCKKEQQVVDVEAAYWLEATRLKALLGLGKSENLQQESKRIYASAPADWIPDFTRDQFDKRENLL